MAFGEMDVVWSVVEGGTAEDKSTMEKHLKQGSGSMHNLQLRDDVEADLNRALCDWALELENSEREVKGGGYLC